jgi:3-oxoacyl-[acyl-carrier protein] reductase
MHLSAIGATVVCLDVDQAAASRVAAAIEDASGRASSHHVDVADEASVQETFDELTNRHGALDALCNCAGITGPLGLPSHEMDLGGFDATIHINLRGALLVSRAVLQSMLEAGYGRIVHVTSIAGKEGNPNMVAYSVSKAGLIGMVKTMGKEYAGTGVTVNALAPAVIATDFIKGKPQDVIDYMTARIPMGRMGEPEEAASLLAWMLSPACSFTTGFTFDLSGGRATY